MSDEKSHSWISFYVVLKTWNKPVYVNTFLKLRRADDWMEGYQYNKDLVGFMVRIDGIEYHINKNGNIRDALKLHEAFYEKEYLAGEKREKEAAKKRKIGWYQLRGKGYYLSHKKDVKYLYTKAKSLDVIAGCIVDIGVSLWNDRFLTGLVLCTPDGKEIELPDFKKVRQPDFYEELGLNQHSHYNRYYMSAHRMHDVQLLRDRVKRWRDQRIKNVRKVIDRSLNNAENKKAA